MPAENENNEWLQDPFKLSGLNGYIYGRGTSDNKVKLISISSLFSLGYVIIICNM